MKSNASTTKTGRFTLPCVAALSLALSLASTSLGAHAAVDTSSWVSTRTKAFLHQVQVPGSTGAVVTADAVATEMAQGEQVHVVLSLNLRNEPQLDKFLEDQHTPGSAAFGSFLTPAQFTTLYAPTQAQVDKVIAHLRQAGFTGIEAAPNRLLVSANGTAATVQQAFNTTLKHFTYQGRRVYANSAVAQVPPALGTIVNAVLGLQNVALNHTHHKIAAGSVSTDVGVKQQAANSLVAHSPTDFPAIYNANSIATASNTTVAIISSGNLTPTIADLAAFTSANGLPTVNADVVQTGPAGSDYSDTSAQAEWSLDSQAITGASGGTKLLRFYAAPTLSFVDVTTAYNRAVTDNVAKVISVSLGSCEADVASSGTQATEDAIFKQAVAQGQTFSVSSGDSGAYNCRASSISGVHGVPNGNQYDVEAPASSPYVVAVGGTRLYTNGTLTYVGETVWNDGLTPIGVYDAAGDYDPTEYLLATGGGYSANEPAPIWQSVLLTGSTKRALPDIAFDAAPASGAQVYYNGTVVVIGGTSLAAPIFSGFWARIQSAHGNRLGFPAKYFYQNIPNIILALLNPPLVQDVTAGYNGLNTTYPGFRAKAGWDGATGFGSLNVSNLNAFITNNPGLWK